MVPPFSTRLSRPFLTIDCIWLTISFTTFIRLSFIDTKLLTAISRIFSTIFFILSVCIPSCNMEVYCSAAACLYFLLPPINPDHDLSSVSRLSFFTFFVPSSVLYLTDCISLKYSYCISYRFTISLTRFFVISSPASNHFAPFLTLSAKTAILSFEALIPFSINFWNLSLYNAKYSGTKDFAMSIASLKTDIFIFSIEYFT